MAFNHHPDHRFLTAGDLLANVCPHFHLLFKLLAGVGVAEVDHHLRRQSGFFQPDLHFRDMFSAVVWLFAAAQNDMAVAVTAGVHNGGMTPFGHGEEAVWRARCVDGVDSHLNGAVSAVFETHQLRPSSSGLPGIVA